MFLYNIICTDNSWDLFTTFCDCTDKLMACMFKKYVN